MKKKISDFYNSIIKNNNTNENLNRTCFEFESLIDLRNYIYEKRKFLVDDLEIQLYRFPMKYLNLVIYKYEDKGIINLNKNFLGYLFKIEFNNNFTRTQINCIIDQIYKKVIGFSMNSFRGPAEGYLLENKVNELFFKKELKKFGKYEYNYRYLFNLKKITKNSIKTINEYRKNEISLMNSFFDFKYYNKIIDDIDTNLDKKYYELNEELYYFSQISLTGKSFIMAILKKKSKGVYYLYLFQVSINKEEELKSYS